MTTQPDGKLKILAAGDSVKLNTGYGKLSRQILGHFASQGHSVLQIAWNHTEPPERLTVNDDSGKVAGFVTIVPPHTGDAFANQSTIDYLIGWEPDMIYHSNDYMVSSSLALEGRKNYPVPFWAQYGIIDGPHCADFAYRDTIKACDMPVVPSKYGLEQILKVNSKAIYIPHGVDRKVFRPVTPDEKTAFKMRFGLADKFVFGSVNRNIWRKQYPSLMGAFANLKHKHNLKDIAMFFICDPNDQFGSQLALWAKVLDLTISNNFSKPADIMFHPGNRNAVITIDEMELARVYNVFDAFVSASMSEGFGLPTIESQACGVPSILCDNTANTELVKGHGWLYPTVKNVDGSDAYVNPTFHQLAYYYSIPDISALEYTMLDAYNKSETRKKYAKASFEFAAQYDWDIILPQWNKVLEAATVWNQPKMGASPSQGALEALASQMPMNSISSAAVPPQ